MKNKHKSAPLKYPNYDALSKHLQYIHLPDSQFRTYENNIVNGKEFWRNYTLEYKRFTLRLQE